MADLATVDQVIIELALWLSLTMISYLAGRLLFQRFLSRKRRQQMKYVDVDRFPTSGGGE